MSAFRNTLFILPSADLCAPQLLNRNPKHRLGATRDAAELKEHAFFSCIDWDALAARQVAPPFKPYVDSDESVANFDPEFTEANLLVEAPHDVLFDEDDPSADWLDQASVRPGVARIPSASGPVAIKARRPPIQPTAPLTSSVQENFRASEFLLTLPCYLTFFLTSRRFYFLWRGIYDSLGGKPHVRGLSRRQHAMKLTSLP